jgi:tetratricopeptide (TPR) repeat protein
MQRALIRHAAAMAVVLVFCCSSVVLRAQARQDRLPTYSDDVRPVVARRCAPCHRPGGSGPFPLVRYEDLRARAKQVVDAVGSRRMPPWHAATAAGAFAGDRRLTEAEVRLFQSWLDGGALQGSVVAGPEVQAPADDWQFGRPDVVLRLRQPYVLPTGHGDVMRNFVLPVEGTARRFVRAWEFRTNRQDVVHHATLMVDPAGSARLRDAADTAEGYEGLIPLSAQSPEGYFLGWTPGQQPYEAPPDLAWELHPGSDLVAMLHLRRQAEAVPVEVSIGLYLTDRPPSRLPVMIRLNRQDLDIAPGQADFVAEDSFVLPVDVDLYGIQPHAHYLAREVRGAAHLPDGRTLALLDVDRWDFHWQDVYRFISPVRLPAGTRLTMTMRFDNTAGNRANPTVPPRRVRFGQGSLDEMADLWLQVVPVRAGDRGTLVTSLRRKLVPQYIQGHRTMLAADPNNAALHDELALLAVENGDVAQAVAAFRASLDLKPENAAAHYNLGNALMMQQRPDEALVHFVEATRLVPEYGLAHQGVGLAYAALGSLEEAIVSMRRATRLLPASADPHYNLGVILQRADRPTEALGMYERVLALSPDHADALYGAGVIYEQQGHHARAVVAFRGALQARADWPAALAELAWVLAVSPDPEVARPDEARSLAARAQALAGGDDRRAADALAAALAATGDYAGATRVLDAWLDRAAGAEASGQDAIRERRDLYREGRPVRVFPP